MVFDYFGTVEKLKQEVDAVKERLDSRYLELLGPEQFAKLERIANRVLSRDAYFDNPADYMRATGETRDWSLPCHCFGTILSETPVKKGIQMNGIVSSAFYLSEDALKKGAKFYNGLSNADQYLPVYVHEFDHFVFSSLQNPSIEIVSGILTPERFNDPMDIRALAKRLEHANIPANEKVMAMRVAIIEYTLKEISELGTRFMDTEVLRPLGVKTSVELMDLSAPVIGSVRINGVDSEFKYQIAGNPFHGMDKSQIIPGLLEWQKHIRFQFKDPIVDEFFQSLHGIKYQYLPFKEYLRRDKKHERRERRLAMKIK